jgi:hypothetical protein
MKTVFDVLIGKFEEDLASSTQFLVGGGAKDFSEYREVCGRVRGLRFAIEETQAFAKNFQENDDD